VINAEAIARRMQMFKVILLLKRKPGTTMKEFINQYETTHAPLVVSYHFRTKRYIRHFLHPAPYPLDGLKLESEYDVLTEMWFDDRRAYDEGISLMTAEKRLFDISKSRVAFVEEYASELLGDKLPDGRTDDRRFVLLKRNPGITMKQFIDHYEDHHQHLVLEKNGEMMTGYRRLFLSPAPQPLDGSILELAYDVATEVSFKANTMASSNRKSDPEVVRLLEADEERFVDRSTRRYAFVESHESVLPWVPETAHGEFVRWLSAGG
jgi:hypothetical protein